MSLNLKNLNITCSPMYNSQNTNEIFGYMCSTNNNRTVEGFQSGASLSELSFTSGILTDPATTPHTYGPINWVPKGSMNSVIYFVNFFWGPLKMSGVITDPNPNQYGNTQIYFFQDGNTVRFIDYKVRVYSYTGTLPPIGSTIDLTQVGPINIEQYPCDLTLIKSGYKSDAINLPSGRLANKTYYPGYLTSTNINNGKPLAIIQTFYNNGRLDLATRTPNPVYNINVPCYTYITFDGTKYLFFDLNSNITYSYSGNLNDIINRIVSSFYGNTNDFDLANPLLTNLGKDYCTFTDFSATQFGVISVGNYNDCYIDNNNNIFPIIAKANRSAVPYSTSTVLAGSINIAQNGNTIMFNLEGNTYTYTGTVNLSDVIDYSNNNVTKANTNLTYYQDSKKINITSPPKTYFLTGGDISAPLSVIGYGTSGTNGSEMFYFVQDGFNIKFLKIVYVIGDIPNPAYKPTSFMLGTTAPARMALKEYRQKIPATIKALTTVASLSSYSLPGILGNTIYLIDPKIKQFGTITNPIMTQTYPNMYNLTT